MRRAPYTEAGLKRLECIRCQESASHQVHSPLDGCWYPVCKKCRIFMSELVFMFVRPDYADCVNLMDQYAESLY